jgi:ATP-dependent protease ClpP protease subunit
MTYTEVMKFELKVLDEKSKKAVLKMINELDKKEGKTALHLILRETKGESVNAFEIIEAVNSSRVDLHVESFGNIGIAGTLLMAAGKPGHRIAHPGSSFQIVHGDKYEDNFNMNSLRPEDDATIEALIALNGKGKKLFEAINTSSFVSEKVAKKLGIIDKTYKIVNKYKNKNDKKAKDAKTSEVKDAIATEVKDAKTSEVKDESNEKN